jgi:hypothetical protein
MMQRAFLSRRMGAVVVVALVLAPVVAWAQTQAEPITEDDIISGTMNIDFRTRTNLDSSGDLKKGSPAIGAQDKYNFNLNGRQDHGV